MTVPTFPQSFPPGCPPADATDASGVVFRLATDNPPTETDLASHAELGKLPNAPPCLRAGLSVLRTRDDATHMSRLFPFLGSFLASGELGPHHGKTKLTPSRAASTHTTWWPYDGVDRRAALPRIEEI